ncbi:hypothetical protein [Kocuria sp. UCD-OTCP]|uniref:hypothetical protein n=1 Tax=Kocuria sp. UCD-OTCP TaxID=1292021 RepID=UPI001237570B|nr:hypothetical protein [Kocuria sp. UCD-OTCP]
MTERAFPVSGPMPLQTWPIADRRVEAFLGALVLVVGLPVWAYLTTEISEDGSAPAWPLLAIVEMAAVRLVWILGVGERRLHEMVFWVFVYVVMGMAPFIQVRMGIEPSTTRSLNGMYYDDALLVILIGCLAWMAGSGFGTATEHQGLNFRHYEVNLLRAQLLFGAMLFATSFYIFSVGPTVLFESRFARSLAAEEAWPNTATSTLMEVGVPMGLLVTYVAQAQAHKSIGTNNARILLGRSLIILNLVALFAVVNPVSSPRYVFGAVLLAVAATLGVYSTLRGFRVVALVAAPAFILLFPLADAFRDLERGEDVPVGVRESMYSGDYDSFAQVLNAVSYVEENGVLWGRQLIGTIFLWVPRSFWPDKPQPTGVVLADFKNYTFHNLSAPIWAELFIDGGWTLLIFGMFCLGLLVRRLDQRAEVVLRAQKMPGLLGCILPFFFIIILRGSLMGVAGGLLVILLGWVIVTDFRGHRT